MGKGDTAKGLAVLSKSLPVLFGDDNTHRRLVAGHEGLGGTEADEGGATRKDGKRAAEDREDNEGAAGRYGEPAELIWKEMWPFSYVHLKLNTKSA